MIARLGLKALAAGQPRQPDERGAGEPVPAVLKGLAAVQGAGVKGAR